MKEKEKIVSEQAPPKAVKKEKPDAIPLPDEKIEKIKDLYSSCNNDFNEILRFKIFIFGELISHYKRFNFYHNFITKIHNTEKFNLDEESLFLEFKSKVLHG